MLGNFPLILESGADGLSCRMFFPALDPIMDEYGHGEADRRALWRHSAIQRARGSEQVASLAEPPDSVPRPSRLTKLRKPQSAPGSRCEASAPDHRQDQSPGVGSATSLWISKIVLNGAIDLAAPIGGTRCFRSHGMWRTAGLDAGGYPDGIQSESNEVTTPEQATEVSQIARNAGRIDRNSRGAEEIGFRPMRASSMEAFCRFRARISIRSRASGVDDRAS